MQRAHIMFSNNINSIRDLDTLYHLLKDTQRLPNDLSDLLRAEIVYAVSALDKLVHELVRIGMIQTLKGQRLKTATFEGFTLSVKTMERIKDTTILSSNPSFIPSSNSDLPEYWFEQEIILKHKSISYQDPKKITEGLSLIWKEEYKWQKIAVEMSVADEKTLKRQLEVIVNRRNQIVHEADMDIVLGVRTGIDANDVKDTVDFIEKLGNAIFNCVK